jgi:two-component system sensor histidine kinase YesM
MVIYETIPQTTWKTLIMVPYKDVARSIYKVKNIMIVIALTSLVVSILLVIAVSSSITKRLLQLRATMKLTEMGNFEVRAEVSGEDEIANLSRNYNKMLESLETSILQLTESRLLQQEAAMSALQSQIHSHFLYNALESINAMANLANRPEIGQTTIALSNMLRYTSNYRDTTVTLKDEFNHLSDYIHIIQVLYGEAVIFDYHIPEACLKVSCLKAIIQPLVENSIKHGLERSGEVLRMKLSVVIGADGYIRIQIVDNGGGFAEEKLIELNDLLNADHPQYKYKQLSRVGLLNVHYRLRMYYPDSSSGVFIANDRSHQGAIVQLVFPAKWHEQEGGLI